MKLFGVVTTLGFAGVLALGAAVLFARRPALLSALVAEGGAVVETGIAYGPGTRRRLDIYRPADASPGGPIVLFLYGGSWRSGERDLYPFLGAALAKRGITVVVPDYRLFPQASFPGFVEDAALAYAWTWRNLARATGRPIALIGHSAGAHIAALLAFDARYIAAQGAGIPRPAAFVGLAGPYAFDPTTFPSTKDIFATAPNADAARPVAFARGDAPPSLLMHGLDDDTVELYNLRDMVEALRAKGADVESVEFPRIGHFGIVLAIARPFRWRAPVLDKTVAFILRHAGASARTARRADAAIR
ncbi:MULTISPECIES: alpha/beta hydrolase [Rhodomicrobium]|uniref:alpha/beta hydrolase n=1 Tax=Rhodomicrobium TaxID=1068 RepID=UPI000F73B458|nr:MULTISPECIES: alpha/beta hydrolase [Rhodomicrobium]